MTDFTNTIDVVGDEALSDSIIERTITEFKPCWKRACSRQKNTLKLILFCCKSTNHIWVVYSQKTLAMYQA